MQDYWHKQTPDNPLFPDILWSRPETRQSSGKLLIIGGNSQGFAAIQESYTSATKAGAGIIHILLPDSLRKSLGLLIPGTSFAPSTPSGSFARESLSEMLDHAAWADVVLLAGDFGKNSETQIVLEGFLEKYHGLLAIAGDTIGYFLQSPDAVLQRENTCVIVNFDQLQKLGISGGSTKPFIKGMGVLLLVQALFEFMESRKASIITDESGSFIVACGGKIVSSKHEETKKLAAVSATATTVWMQNPTKQFESIASSFVL